MILTLKNDALNQANNLLVLQYQQHTIQKKIMSRM